MNAWVWWWQQYAQGAIDAYAARIGCRIRTPALTESVGRLGLRGEVSRNP